MKLVVVSICKDESKTIGQVLDGVPKKIHGITETEKWVIDDGSSDNTPEIAVEHDANVIHDGSHKKLAFRFREAIDIALTRGAEVMVNIDGDLQFDPKDVPKLVEPIVNGQADFTAADRFTDAKSGQFRRPTGMSKGKYWGNRLGAKIVSKLSNENFRDVTCGFRAYNRKALFGLNTDGSYTYTQESFQILAMKKMRITTIPINVTYHAGRQSRVVKSIFHFIAVSAVGILRSYRDFAPLRFFGWLGFIPFFTGLVCLAIFLIHWVVVGHPSPFKFLGFGGGYLLTMGIIFWALGLVADMMSRMLNNQEKILGKLKEMNQTEIDRRLSEEKDK